MRPLEPREGDLFTRTCLNCMTVFYTTEIGTAYCSDVCEGIIKPKQSQVETPKFSYESDNRAYIHYCYPTSDMAKRLGSQGYYVVIGTAVISPVSQTVAGVEGFCRNHSITFQPHHFKDR